MDLTIAWEITKVAIPFLLGVFTLGFGVYKLVDKRFTRLEDLMIEVSSNISKGVTMSDCVVNSRRAEDKWNKAIEEVEARTDKKIEDVKEHIEDVKVRLNKLESK